MAHGHHHHGESVRDYFTEQLLTILVCGLFGFAAIQMYRAGMLGFLAKEFQTPVLYGGIGVLVLTVFRAVAVWREAGEIQAKAAEMGCGLDHVHGAECAHDPGIGGDHDHDHGHDHDHSHGSDLSWVFARMMVLAFPVLLFFLGLPPSSFSKERQLGMVGNERAIDAKSLKELAESPDTVVSEEKPQADGSVVRTLTTKTGLTIRATVPKEGPPTYALVTGDAVQLSFNDLNDAAFDEAKRQSMEGMTVYLEGRFKRLADKEFTLFRLKMTCCAADTVPLKVRIVVPQALGTFEDFAWVGVKGQLQFYRVPQEHGPARYVPAIMVADITDVERKPAKSEYE